MYKLYEETKSGLVEHLDSITEQELYRKVKKINKNKFILIIYYDIDMDADEAIYYGTVETYLEDNKQYDQCCYKIKKKNIKNI